MSLKAIVVRGGDKLPGATYLRSKKDDDSTVFEHAVDLCKRKIYISYSKDAVLPVLKVSVSQSDIKQNLEV
jgi:hypothetical protein